MENVPWHDEVLHFVRELNSRLSGGTYDIASEHEHSNCVLIAHKKFLVAGRWHTWIDYEKFHRLVQEREEDRTRSVRVLAIWSLFSMQFKRDKSMKHFLRAFTSTDYTMPTPPWAVFGSSERGFDPEMQRVRRKKKSDPDG